MYDRIKADGFNPVAVGRRLPSQGEGVVGDLAQPKTVRIDGEFGLLIHMAPLWLLPDNLENFASTGIQRVIAFSSTSIETKKTSEQKADKMLVKALHSAEERSWRITQDRGMGLTIFRPTMIYGFCRDKNVTTIANLIRRYGFFPIAGSGSGMRQPVHSLDLVTACLRSLDHDITAGKTYSLGGGERLSYKRMVECIFTGLGLEPKTPHIAVSVYKAVLAILQRLNMMTGVSLEAIGRMNEDFSFDNGPAEADFGYSGSMFLNDPERDLPRGSTTH